MFEVTTKPRITAYSEFGIIHSISYRRMEHCSLVSSTEGKINQNNGKYFPPNLLKDLNSYVQSWCRGRSISTSVN